MRKGLIFSTPFSFLITYFSLLLVVPLFNPPRACAYIHSTINYVAYAENIGASVEFIS